MTDQVQAVFLDNNDFEYITLNDNELLAKYGGPLIRFKPSVDNAVQYLYRRGDIYRFAPEKTYNINFNTPKLNFPNVGGTQFRVVGEYTITNKNMVEPITVTEKMTSLTNFENSTTYTRTFVIDQQETISFNMNSNNWWECPNGWTSLNLTATGDFEVEGNATFTYYKDPLHSH